MDVKNECGLRLVWDKNWDGNVLNGADDAAS